MDRKSSYTLFPPPKSPTSTTQSSATRSRRSTSRRRRSTSLDPLPPIEEPPHLPPVPDAPRPESPVLKSIHSLYNPRPSSRHTHTDQSRPLSQHQDSSKFETTNRQPSPPRRASLQHYPPPSLEHHLPPTQRPRSSQEMQVPSPSTASSLSLQKPPLLSPTSTLQAQPPPVPQPKVAYFHGGIGGRGNYRKVVRESNRAPLAHARNVSPPHGRSARFLSSLFGGSRRRRTSPENSNGDLPQGRGSEESFGSGGSQEVSLGAAEVMRRKLLRQAGFQPKANRNNNNNYEGS